MNSTGTSTDSRGNRASWISVGFAPPSRQETLPSCPQPATTTPSRLPFETHPSRSERQRRLKAFRHGKQAGKWPADNHPRFSADTTDDSKFDIAGRHDDGVWVSPQDEDRVFVEPLHVLVGFSADHGWLGKKRPRCRLARMDEVLGGSREQADKAREELHAELTALRKETASLRAGTDQAAAAKTAVEVSEGHGALLREAAWASSSTVLCHRDAWEFSTAHAGRQPHFRVPAQALGQGEKRVRAALSGRSSIALLITLHRSRKPHPRETATRTPGHRSPRPRQGKPDRTVRGRPANDHHPRQPRHARWQHTG
ncbi:hypothetical protein [Streptomyces celluloflavus]|uniref:hypothetical protein n=1 Tax=Streptomyces celluloflavus TaxID=58344 RepID=UPI00366541C9